MTDGLAAGAIQLSSVALVVNWADALLFCCIASAGELRHLAPSLPLLSSNLTSMNELRHSSSCERRARPLSIDILQNWIFPLTQIKMLLPRKTLLKDASI